ncbi:nuclear envelope integral membrane protein 1-like isoform X2 [Apostichopus japonicus]|uniref:nuclear envelope integral membrane protein 1-like isoform X2 n=1 Tax=Stichopus japonicus TaxID=307972 RepID=UPI003AB5772F
MKNTFQEMMSVNLLLILTLVSVSTSIEHDANTSVDGYFPTSDKDIQGFKVYCYIPKTGFPVLKSFSSLWVEVKPTNPQNLPSFYCGNNASEVRADQKNKGFLHLPHGLWKCPGDRLSVLHQSCLGVECEDGCELHGKLREIDPLYIGLFVAGLLIFLYSPTFSRSVYFHYSSGVTIGILASLLIIVYIISRFIPKKIGAIAFVTGGWSLVVYFIREVGLSLFATEYREYILAYFVVAGILSFIVCYWYGPIQNDRTVHILEGVLYLIGCLLIYSGIQHKPTAVAFIALMAGITFLRRKGIVKSMPSTPRLRWWWNRKRYPSVRKRLLSIDEFEQEAVEETKKALEQLREYCNSPQCNAWKMINKMETPERFAQFVLGDDHLSEHELTLYDSDMSIPPEPEVNDSLLTSDSDSEW